MSDDRSDTETQSVVRAKLNKMLGQSGLLEYSCPTPSCQTQIFTTWQVRLTCDCCGEKVRSIYTF